MKKIIFTLSFIFFSIFLSTTNIFAAGEDSFTYSPDPIPTNSDITFTIKGRGFGFYSLSIATNLTLDFQKCVKISGNTTIYKSFNCTITNESDDKQEWTATVVRAGLTNGTYQIVLNPNKVIESTFLVGAPRPSADFETLNVRIYSSSDKNFSGPFSNTVSNELVIEWNPAIVGGQYEIETTHPQIPALSLTTCQSSVCTRNISLPVGTSTGTHTVTVKRRGEATRGTTTFTITSERVGELSTPTPSPPPPPCQGGVCVTALGNIATDPGGFIKNILTILLSLAGGIALLLIIASGYRLMASQGNPERVQAAREQLTSAIVGLLFIIFSLSILTIIGVDILKIPGFSAR